MRFFQEAEVMLYLSAFGHSLAAELNRCNTLAADQAKGNFISSVSHELRSPLHGVLAGVELLQDSELTGYQKEMAHMIAMAGRTLLDTYVGSSYIHVHWLITNAVGSIISWTIQRSAALLVTNAGSASPKRLPVTLMPL